MQKNLAAHVIQNILTDVGRKWKIDGRLAEPTINDVERLIEKMFEDMLSTDYDSVESGGILLKRDGPKIDIYVHVGELNED